MKAVMNALMATALLGSIALADDMDEQIQKLEKETKLLELKKENEQLKNDTKMVNQNNTQENNSSTSKSKNGKSVKAYSKNGGFIGVEGFLGGNNMSNRVLGGNSGTMVHYVTRFARFDGSKTTFDLGLVGGYQHYFGSSQKHGIKVSAHIYSGFGNTWKSSYDPIESTLSYIPIKFGFDVKYVWDFLERGKHVLGLNVGVGYEFDFYVNGKENGYLDDEVAKLDSMFLNSFYPVIGLHYYYGHNQFELLYRFGGNNWGKHSLSDESQNKDVYHESSPDDVINYNVTLTTQSYFAINYAYRF